MALSSEVALYDDRTLLRDCVSALLVAVGVQVAISTGDVDEFLAGLSLASPAVAILVFHSLRNAAALRPEEGRLLEILREGHPRLAPVVIAPTSEPSFEAECKKHGAVAFINSVGSRANELAHTVLALCRGERPGNLAMLLSAAASQPTSTPIQSLSTREREVLTWITAGADNLKISSHLEISERTVKAHVSAIYRKLGAQNRTQLAVMARQLGVMPPVGT
ncbi:MAG: LuxR C-terminal-related transcriptional regulator [Myxococcaceae bacterium]